ncbi:hypothetical protein [Pseudomonas mediterranea]|jgi:hypothetical protein|uniref:hypothetical protein n=1 Tax=Pseudomonas mediterranea TaxID=183795 RepID=UPI0006D8A327|nr:hypothetical protein [Pseudomonas mediterranea]MBL0842201.1 hypothetical protein [Pseudomonas mediterranea]MDU9026617.1 hypothetical protein [Pseudomonas mediterranea]UZE01517.1 hypothetical protein LOY71_02470 [Pseudomonas mediterranea]CAH0189596.1 hypothetical protein SRABI112_01615 [Pseudomonas mediterranea]
MDQTVRPRDEMSLDALPGGHQSVLGALPQALKDCLAKASRVVLVANNPAITEADFRALDIGSDDVVVTFNTCMKAAFLTPQSVNVFVHGFNAPDAYFFGLPYKLQVQRLFELPGARCFTMLVGCTGAMSPLPGVALYQERIPLPPLWNYPIDRVDGKRYVGPSTGFNALVVFDWLRGNSGYTYRLMTLGFSNEAGKFWSGHAWEYERQWLLEADVTVVPLQHKRWWQGWFRHR